MINPKKAPVEDPPVNDEETEMELTKSQDVDDEEEKETYLDLPGDEIAGDGFPENFYH